jgi:transcriptional regulator with XRE-family HTH domain
MVIVYFLYTSARPFGYLKYTFGYNDCFTWEFCFMKRETVYDASTNSKPGGVKDLMVTPKEIELFYADERVQEHATREIGQRIKSHMEKQGLTYDQVAEELGFKNKSAVSHIVTGRTKPGLFHLLNLAQLLNVDVKALLPPSPSVQNENIPAGGKNSDLLKASNLELAHAYLKRELELDGDRALAIAIQAATNLGGIEASEQEIMREVMKVISQQLNGGREKSG